MQTRNKTRMPDKFIMADRTLSGSVGRIDIDNPASLTQSLILNKALQLPESPLMNPFVVFSILADERQIFHHNNASFPYRFYDAFADIVVSPCHKLSPSARHSFKFSFGRFCAFGLKPTNQIIMQDSFALDLFSKKHLGRCHSKLIYADINSKNSILEARAFGIDVFGKSKKEIASAFFVYGQKAFLDIPTEIIFVAVGNAEWNLNTTFDCSQAQDIVLERRTSWEVISHRYSLDYRLGFSLLDHTAGLLDASDSKLRLQSKRTQMLINKRMKFNIIPDFPVPRFVDAELQSLSVKMESLDYFLSCRNLDFSGCSCFHNINVEQLIYKPYGQMSSGGWQFLSILKNGVSLPYTL